MNSYRTTNSKSWPCKDNKTNKPLPLSLHNLRQPLARYQLITISNGFRLPRTQIMAALQRNGTYSSLPPRKLWPPSNPNQPQLLLFQMNLQQRPSLQVLLVSKIIHKFWRHRESSKQLRQLLGSDKRLESDSSNQLVQLFKSVCPS